MTKLDRLAQSVPDARAIGDDLAARRIKLSFGGQVYDPTDPDGQDVLLDLGDPRRVRRFESTNETVSGETCSTIVTGMRWRWSGWS